MEKEVLAKVIEGMNGVIQKTRQSAYENIMAEVMKTDIKPTSRTLIGWALAKHFNIETDIFETKEKWI